MTGVKGKQLIIKPNMVSTSKPLCATHVDALRGLLEFVKPFYSGQILIAEATAGNGDTMPGFQIMDIWNFRKISILNLLILIRVQAVRYGFSTENLYPERIPITDMFLDPNNYIISISRLKTHNAVVMTAATKNMVMAAPLNISAANGNPQINNKSKMHSGGSRWLHYNMFLVAKHVRPDFAIIDGVEGMQGNGPSSGFAVDHRIALAGDDVVAIDTLCCKLMGIPLENVGYLNYCAADGLGIIDSDKDRYNWR